MNRNRCAADQFSFSLPGGIVSFACIPLNCFCQRSKVAWLIPNVLRTAASFLRQIKHRFSVSKPLDNMLWRVPFASLGTHLDLLAKMLCNLNNA